MPRVEGPDGVRWTIRRRWSTPSRLLPDPGADPTGIATLIVVVLALPRLIAFPFAAAARLLGLRAWVVEASRPGAAPVRTAVRGTRAADAQVEAWAADVRAGRPPREGHGAPPLSA